MLDSGLALLQTGVEGPCVPVCSGHPQPSPGEVGTPQGQHSQPGLEGSVESPLAEIFVAPAL